MSGYDTRIFAVKPCDSLVCPLCLNIINDAMQCPNGHGYCSECIRSSLDKRKECPICKINLTVGGLGRSLYANNAVHAIPTFCISSFDEFSKDLNDEDMCKWTGVLSQRESHLELDCENRMTKCTIDNCNELIRRKLLPLHLEVCKFRQVNCEFCNETMIFSALETHCVSCLLCPVTCPNGCSEMLKKDDVESHTLNDCSHHLIECPFHKLNGCFECTGSVCRGKMEQHISAPYRTVAIICRQTDTINKQQHSIRELQTQVSTLDSSLTHFKEEFAAVANSLKSTVDKQLSLDLNHATHTGLITGLVDQMNAMTQKSTSVETDNLQIRSMIVAPPATTSAAVVKKEKDVVPSNAPVENMTPVTAHDHKPVDDIITSQPKSTTSPKSPPSTAEKMAIPSHGFPVDFFFPMKGVGSAKVTKLNPDGTYDVELVANGQMMRGVSEEMMERFCEETGILGRKTTKPIVTKSAEPQPVVVATSSASTVSPVRHSAIVAMLTMGVNSLVEAKSTRDGKWYSAKITHVRENKNCDIIYGVGATLSDVNVPRSQIHALSSRCGDGNSLFQEGVAVEILVSAVSENTWLPGKILRVDDSGVFDLCFDSNNKITTQNVPATRIRLACSDEEVFAMIEATKHHPGTAVEYLNKKGNRVSGCIMSNDPSKADCFTVQNDYGYQASVHINVMRLVVGSKMTVPYKGHDIGIIITERLMESSEESFSRKSSSNSHSLPYGRNASYIFNYTEFKYIDIEAKGLPFELKLKDMKFVLPC